LEQMRGRIEVGLKAFWYEGAAVAEVVRENETIRRMRDALNGRSPTETYYERIRLGEEVEHALAQKRTRDEETILARIRPLVHKPRTKKSVSERMVVNAAFLVDRQNGLQFDDAVRRLSDEFNDPTHVQIFRTGTAVQFRQYHRQLGGMSVGLLGHTLTAPLLGPIRGLLWLARTIEERAKTELYDEDKIRGELTELELALDLKQIDLTDYEAREEVLLRRVEGSPAVKGELAPPPPAASSPPPGAN